MITLKTAFVWLVIFNILLFGAFLVKAFFFLDYTLVKIFLRLFTPGLFFVSSWFCYFNGINIETGEVRYHLRRVKVTEGDKALLFLMSKPIAYLTSFISLFIFLYYVFLEKYPI